MTGEAAVVLTGTVLPGQTMAPPYATDVRCVIWMVSKGLHDTATSRALPFKLLVDDGREVLVVPSGAFASLPVRMELILEVPPADSGEFKGKRTNRTSSRIISWLGAGDRVTVTGLLSNANPFRGTLNMQASQVRVDSVSSLITHSLEAGDPEE